MTAFEKGEVEESIKLFDAAEEADPRYATRLWQRGLSYYYADRFKDARKQFLMDVAENPNDTEEAVWHLLAMARTEGLAKARPQMIKMGRDPRRVMRTVEEAFRNGDAESIGALEAIATDGGGGQRKLRGGGEGASRDHPHGTQGARDDLHAQRVLVVLEGGRVKGQPAVQRAQEHAEKALVRLSIEVATRSLHTVRSPPRRHGAFRRLRQVRVRGRRHTREDRSRPAPDRSARGDRHRPRDTSFDGTLARQMEIRVA